MDALPIEPLPRAEQRSNGRVALILNPDYGRRVEQDDLFRLPDILRALPGRESRRRGTVTSWLWRPAWHDGPGLRIRRYAHGGMWGGLAGTLFLGERRMHKELQLSLHACRRGVPTAVPVAVRTARAWGPYVTAHFVSENVPDAVNLLELLETVPALTAARRRSLAKAIASAVAAMHEAGILHADLNLKNILVRGAPDRPEAFVVDFDKSRLLVRLSLDQRMANLMRLERSVAKWPASRRAAGPMDCLRVLRAYLERDAEWRAHWGTIARRYARQSALRRST